MTWGKPRAEDGRAYVGTRAPTWYSSSSLGLAVKSPWPRKPQARAHRPRRSCLLVSSLRMRSTAVGVRMRAALPRARACAHGIFVSRRWRGSAPLNVGLLNAFGRPLCGGSVHDKFHQGDLQIPLVSRRVSQQAVSCDEPTARRAFKCQRSMVRTN